MTSASPLSPTVTATELAELLAGDDDVVVVEVRRRGVDRASAAVGHVPGAHTVELGDLAGARGPGTGASPLPDAALVGSLVERWGIHDDTQVVVYSPDHPSSASRLWWLLRWAGNDTVRLLDGGLGAWLAQGGELSDAAAPTGGGTASIRLGSMPTLDADEAASLAREGHLLDARGHDAYRGADDDQGGQATGHIPGAISVPSTDLLSDGLLGDEATTRARFAEVLDGQPIGTYCGSGVAATLHVVALESLGVRAPLYPGSWSAWSEDADRPVAKGAEPG